MSVEKVRRKSGELVYRVRWRQGGRNRARTFSTKRDALDYDAERRRSARAGTLALLDAGTETLNEYVTHTWVPAHGSALTSKTLREYARMYDRHVEPRLGETRLRELSPDQVARLQADLLRAGLGHESVRKVVHVMLGGILRRAVESQRIGSNPVRLLRMPRAPKRQEVRPLAPVTVEQVRSALCERTSTSLAALRDSTVVSVLAYSGIRPGELRRLRWAHVRDATLYVAAGKTDRERTVRLLAPLAADLREWHLASGRRDDAAFVLPDSNGGMWTENGFNKWRDRVLRPALLAVGLQARPYDLRHSFASLLLHEGRSPIYVARQLGHGADLTLKTYGHVIDELEDAPSLNAEDAIRQARRRIHGELGTRFVPVEAV